jgi:hypothetical protein
VREHLLENVFGFEYLIAPYTIAHLKLSQYLSDQGHPLKGDERLQVFLTNTLEPIEPQKNWMLLRTSPIRRISVSIVTDGSEMIRCEGRRDFSMSMIG